MSTRIYNQRKVSVSQASPGDASTTVFAYRGFNSRNVKTGFKENDIDLIKQDLLNHFNIKKGEKLMNPDFGTIIWSMIYEPMNDENIGLITKDVEAIINRDPRTQALKIKIDTSEHGILINVDLLYKALNISESLQLGFEAKDIPTT
jgi:phage baseplate assembly protein W